MIWTVSWGRSVFKKKWMTVDSWYIPSLILSKARGSFNSTKHICQLKVSWLTWWETTSTCSPDEGGGSSEVVWGCPRLPKASKSFQWAAWLNRLQVLKINQPTGRKLCCHSFYVSWSWAGLTLCRWSDQNVKNDLNLSSFGIPYCRWYQYSFSSVKKHKINW